MNSKRQIFLVYACDEWKSTESLRLEMATTSVRRLKSFVAKKIKDGDYDYYDVELSRTKQAEQFKRDFDNEPRSDINGRLLYGFIDYTHDGEEI